MANRGTGQETGPQHQLPDFKPKGMSRGSTIMAWTLTTIVVIFVLGTVASFLNKSNQSATTAHPHPTVTVTATPKIDKNATVIKLTAQDKWFIDAYATLHKVSEQVALTQLIEAGIHKAS